MRATKQAEQLDQNKMLAELIAKIEAQRKRNPERARFPKKVKSLVLRTLEKGVSSNKLILLAGFRQKKSKSTKVDLE